MTIERSTQKKLVQGGQRSKQFTLQMYEKQRVHTSSHGILFPYHPKQKHADAGGVGVGERSERNVASLLHSEAEGCGERVEGLHEAVEGDDTVGKAEDTGGTTDEEASRGVGGAVAGMDENTGAAGNALQTRQARAPRCRPRTGRTRKTRRGNVEAEAIFARGDGGMRTCHRGFEGGHGTQAALRRQ